MSVAVIQGASGSIGSHLARGILSRSGLQVVATSRNPDRAREAILSGSSADEKRLTVLKVDAKDESTIEEAARQVKNLGKLRLLINVTGVLHPEKSLQQITARDMLDSFELNTFSHLLTYKHFGPLLPTNKDVKNASEQEDHAQGLVKNGLSICASLTARVGSIADNGRGGWYSYRASKAATNQVIRTLEHELRMKSTPSIAVALHPGTVVNTNLSKGFTKEEDAGKKPGVFHPDESAGKLLDVLSSLGEKDGGRFLDWAGKDIQW